VGRPVAEALFLGLDAGGSKTVCLAGDRLTTIGRGESGPANPSVGGLAGFRAAIAAAVGDALGGRAASGALSAWIGVAGADTPTMRRALHAAALEALDARKVTISHDARLILAAAGVRSGIAVVAGTGSAVYGLAADGREVTLGGWGHLLGDEGSGYDIARQALRAVTQAADGRAPRTQLSEALFGALGVSSARGLRELLYPAASVPEVARLARLVLELAGQDEAASEIVARAARDLAVAVRTCRERLETAGRAQLPVVAAGGLMSERSPLLERLTEELEQVDDGYRVMPLSVEPAVGALALARDGPGPVEEEEVLERDEHIQQQPKESLS
jgi:glucosamine kinase